MKEVRMQLLRPRELTAELTRLPLVFLPLGPLEWHGLHLSIGMDPINAERVALELANQLGGVVHPTLYMGTERERGPNMLESLGFQRDAYMVGMDFPTALELYKSFYYSEEMFALTVRAHLEQFVDHGYQFICIVNGHGASNHNAVLERLCREFSQRLGLQVCYVLAFPKADATVGSIAHAGSQETSLLMYYEASAVDLTQLPPSNLPLTYAEHGVVDSGGFSGDPHPGYTVPGNVDPRLHSSVTDGRKIFGLTITELSGYLRRTFKLPSGSTGNSRQF